MCLFLIYIFKDNHDSYCSNNEPSAKAGQESCGWTEEWILITSYWLLNSFVKVAEKPRKRVGADLPDQATNPPKKKTPAGPKLHTEPVPGIISMPLPGSLAQPDIRSLSKPAHGPSLILAKSPMLLMSYLLRNLCLQRATWSLWLQRAFSSPRLTRIPTILRQQRLL